MIRVLVVDDSAFVRQALTRMLGSAPDIEIVGTAVDGKDGWAKAVDLRPDVVTLDIKMPRMDGLEALRRIMADCPTAVLLLSSQTKEGAEVTLRGLELGAMDFVDKSSVQGHMNLLSLAEELKAKVRALASVPRSRLCPARPGGPARDPCRARRGRGDRDLDGRASGPAGHHSPAARGPALRRARHPAHARRLHEVPGRAPGRAQRAVGAGGRGR
jgi:two-component system chemotaxis response regulator CheB